MQDRAFALSLSLPDSKSESDSQPDSYSNAESFSDSHPMPVVAHEVQVMPTTFGRLIVFLPSAKALTFQQVTIQVDDVNLLIFDYVSAGTGVTRRAKFYVSNIVGYATN